MLTESFIAATSAVNKTPQHLTAALKDVGIFQYEFQPQRGFRQGFKKSSAQPACIAISREHIFAAQADKAVINVYNREKGNQEVTVPLPERIKSLCYAEAAEILVIGTEEGKLVLWEVASGRLSTSAASHLQAISSLCLTPNNDYILSASADATVFVWSLHSLVSFTSPSDDYGNSSSQNAPVGTFDRHQTPVTALYRGHSRSNTNFAVSASNDNICYIWHIETCQVLRTVLLPETPICATLDPADRAVYFGSINGGLMSIDLLSLAVKGHGDSESSKVSPSQITPDAIWAPTSQLGAANSITLSYDATSILSAHASGAIVEWDVAKRRMASEIANLGQPVTNISMLRPAGLREENAPGYRIPAVIKPKLELSTFESEGTSRIPNNYNLSLTLTGAKRLEVEADGLSSGANAMLADGWPDYMLEDAIRAIESSLDVDPKQSNANLVKTERLQDEIVALRQQLDVLNKVDQNRSKYALNKVVELGELGERRRHSYFEARNQGQDGDMAMQPYEEQIDNVLNQAKAGAVDAMDTA